MFDWVDRVSIELTTMMLATLFDFPFEERRKLTYWSDVAICNVNAPDAPVHSEQERFAEMKVMAEMMAGLFNERQKGPPKFDLLSMLAHGTRNARNAVARMDGHAGAADRRRQRHDAQFDERRTLGTAPAPGRISQVAGESGTGSRHGVGDHPLRHAGDPHAPDRNRRMPRSMAGRSARATRS